MNGDLDKMARAYNGAYVEPSESASSVRARATSLKLCPFWSSSMFFMTTAGARQTSLTAMSLEAVTPDKVPSAVRELHLLLLPVAADVDRSWRPRRGARPEKEDGGSLISRSALVIPSRHRQLTLSAVRYPASDIDCGACRRKLTANSVFINAHSAQRRIRNSLRVRSGL